MKDEKWTMFKNYMHNELGVTKDDIRAWIKEAVKDVAERMVANEYEKFDAKKIITEVCKEAGFYTSPSFNKNIIEKVGKEIASRLQIKVNTEQ